MWFSTFLSFLMILKLSSADLGLPVSIPDLRSTITSEKGKGIETINKIIRQIEAISLNQYVVDFVNIKLTLQAVLGNITEIQNNTLNSLLLAVNDNRSSPRKVFDQLYSDIESSHEQLWDSQKAILGRYSSMIGTEKLALFNASLRALSSSLKTLETVLTLIDDSIVKAQQTKPITQENVQNVVTKTQIADIAIGVAFIETSISKAYLLAESSFKSFKLIDQDVNRTYTQKNNIFSLEGVFNATESCTTPIEKNLHGVVAKLNSTVLSVYKSLIKSSSKDGAEILKMFLDEFDRVVKFLNKTASDIRPCFRDYVLDKLPQRVGFIDKAVQSNLNSAAFQMMKNYTFAEMCVQKCPLVSESMNVVIKMLKNCIQPQLDYLLGVERMFIDFIQSISAVVLAPWEDFSLCSSKLDKTLCLSKFTATYFGTNSADLDTSILIIKMFQRSAQLFVNTRSDLNGAFTRIILCESVEDLVPSLKPLGSKRMACYETGNSSVNFN